MKAITISLIMYLSLTNAQHIKIRAYTVNNNINSFLKIVPHVAIEVQTCYDNNMTCSLTSYGKAKNGKIYSPDILSSFLLDIILKILQTGNLFQIDFLNHSWLKILNQKEVTILLIIIVQLLLVNL